MLENYKSVFAYNFATHVHYDSDFSNYVYQNYPSQFNRFIHYSRIGSKYCPRVLQVCEEIVNINYSTNPPIKDLMEYIEHPHSEHI